MVSRFDRIELGSTPADEPCAQVGSDYYYLKANQECDRYLQLLMDKFPIPNILKGEVRFSKVSNRHDFGTYYEVAVFFNEENDLAGKFAIYVENNLPAKWDDTTILSFAIVLDQEVAPG